MKYLYIPSFDFLENEITIYGVDGRVLIDFEAFSCKMIKCDKKRWKTVVDKKTHLKLANPACFDSVPPIDLTYMDSGFTSFYRPIKIEKYREKNKIPPIIFEHRVWPGAYLICPKLLCHLSSTLRYILEDPDKELSERNFSYEPDVQGVINYVDSIVITIANSYQREARNKLWLLVNSAIVFNRCSIFKYISFDIKSDRDPSIPHLLFVFFFYDHELKRIYTMSVKNAANAITFSNESINSYYCDDDLEGS